MANYDGWLPMGEVIQRTGMSERTIYRHVTEGKIRQGQRPIPGRKPLSVYHPDDVAAVAAFVSPKNIEILPPLTKLAESLKQAAESRRIEAPKDDSAEDSAMAEWRNWSPPLWVTEEQAVLYSGLGAWYLRTAVQWKLIGPRGARVCRRSDLDAL